MALEHTTEHHPLACGRDVERVRADLERGRWDEHEQHCPHCAAAAASLRALHDAAAELRDDPTEPSPGLLDAIMNAVRADTRRHTLLPLTPPRPARTRGPASGPLVTTGTDRGGEADHTNPAADTLGGHALIATEAVAAVLRYTADTIDGLRARHCAITVTGADPEGGDLVAIELTVAVLYRSGPIPELLTDLRWRLITAAEAQAGLTVAIVDVTVEDVYLPEH